MSQNIVLTQRHTNDLSQMKNILSMRNLHYNTEEMWAGSVPTEAPGISSLKKQPFISQTNDTLKQKEENGGECQTGGTMETKFDSHFLAMIEDEDSELGHDYNEQSVRWNSSDDDYDGDNTGDEDTALSETVAIQSKQLLLDEDADIEEEGSGDYGNSDDEIIDHECDGSSIDEKSESCFFRRKHHKCSQNDKNDGHKEVGSNSLKHLTGDVESEMEDESLGFVTRESNPLDLLDDEYHDSEMESIYVNETHGLPQDSLSKELQQYFDQSPAFRFRLQYEVCIVLIHPLFVLEGRKETAFLNFYDTIFGKNLLSTGFSSVYELCKAMPHVVNGKLLDERSELYLVESPRNLRVVAGIRSGLRRIVYNILQAHPLGISSRDFEGVFFNEIGKTLTDVLKEHAYASPKVECMVQDMLDIACFSKPSQTIVLCNDAEDPALTDGLLIGRKTNNSIPFNGSSSVSNRLAANRVAEAIDECADHKFSEKKIAGNHLTPVTCHIGKPLHNLSSGHHTRALEEQKSSQISTACEKTVSCSEEYILQVKLCLRMLLACWDSGNGIEASNLQEIYEKTFATNLNLNGLGYTSTQELLNCWSDITLLVYQKPGFVFLKPSVENKRILKTVATGLRASVFSVLLSSFPDGMDIGSFVRSLNQSYSGNLQEILEENGYLNGDMSEINAICGDERHHLQQYTSKTLRLLFHDLSDFVRFGCQEDGSVVVKLLSEGFPILDFPDCNLDGFQPETIFEDKVCSKEAGSSLAGRRSQNGYVKEQVSNFESGMHTSALKMDGNIQDLAVSVSSAYSKSSLLVLKHQFQLILGSPMYLNSGIHCQQLSSIYEERAGQPLFLAGHKDVKYLMSLMPDIVSMDSESGRVFLKRTNQNSRILSVVKSGIRQVLYWSLLKNSAGIWDQLLEGWYTDFVGNSLVMTLHKHGYKISRKLYLSSISTFLEDMHDFVCQHSTEDGLYVLSDDAEDPTVADARLLSVSVSDIQYDPLREHFQSFYSEVDGFGKGSSDILDLLRREPPLKENEIDDFDNHDGTFKHVLEHSVPKACMNSQGRQKFSATNADEDNSDNDEEEPRLVTTRPNENATKSVFELENEDIRLDQEICTLENKKSNFNVFTDLNQARFNEKLKTFSS